MKNPKERVCKCGCKETYIPTGCRQQFKEGHSPLARKKSKAVEARARRDAKKMEAATEQPAGGKAGSDEAKKFAATVCGSMVNALVKAKVLDMAVAAGLIAQQKVDDMIAFVKKQRWVNEPKGL
jgi:hypothetical protein